MWFFDFWGCCFVFRYRTDCQGISNDVTVDADFERTSIQASVFHVRSPVRNANPPERVRKENNTKILLFKHTP